MELQPLPLLVNVHVVLESLVQQASEQWSEVVGFIRVDVNLIIHTLEEVATSTLGHGEGVSKEKVIKPFLTK